MKIIVSLKHKEECSCCWIQPAITKLYKLYCNRLFENNTSDVLKEAIDDGTVCDDAFKYMFTEIVSRSVQNTDEFKMSEEQSNKVKNA